MSVATPPPEELSALLRRSQRIAVVGASTSPAKPSHRIPAYLQRQGYDVLPVRPDGAEVLGRAAVATLADLSEPVDLVNVFRPADETPEIARQAAAIGAPALWLQQGIAHPEVARIGADAAMTVVMDACLGVVHARLLGDGSDGP